MSIFHRRVEIASTETSDEGEVRAALEDDFHHFRVWARYRDAVVSEIGAEAVRYPYTACPEAAGQLEQLIGMPLNRVAHSVMQQTDARHQCTHMLDLAGLAIAAAARGTARRVYDVQVPQRIEERTCATLQRDGEPLLRWDIHASLIKGPAPYTNVNLREGMARWALTNLNAEEAEAALVLRRCALISLGKDHNLDEQSHAANTGRCYSQQSVRAGSAVRIKGSTWDFSASQATLCADDQHWLQAIEAVSREGYSATSQE